MNYLLGFINLGLSALNLTFFIVNLGIAPVVLSALTLFAALLAGTIGVKFVMSGD